MGYIITNLPDRNEKHSNIKPKLQKPGRPIFGAKWLAILISSPNGLISQPLRLRKNHVCREPESDPHRGQRLILVKTIKPPKAQWEEGLQGLLQKSLSPPFFVRLWGMEETNMTQNYKTMSVSIILDRVFMVYGMPRHANDLLGEVDVFIGITCQCLVVGENPQVRWSRGNFEIVYHHSYVYLIIIYYYNPSSFNCLIDSMFINIYSSYTFLLNQSSQYQLLHKPIPNWKGVWTYPQTLIVMWIWRKEPPSDQKNVKIILLLLSKSEETPKIWYVKHLLNQAFLKTETISVSCKKNIKKKMFSSPGGHHQGHGVHHPPASNRLLPPTAFQGNAWRRRRRSFRVAEATRHLKNSAICLQEPRGTM